MRRRRVADRTGHHAEMQIDIRQPGPVRSSRLGMAAETDISPSNARRSDVDVMGAVAIEAERSLASPPLRNTPWTLAAYAVKMAP